MPKSVEFYSEGCKIAADLYYPEFCQPGMKIPAIILCHGFAGIKELLLPSYAEKFAAAGYMVLLFDYRGFGQSEGERGRLVPAEQVVDIRNAITFLETLEEVDPERIGLWGSSFGGANVITTAAIDGRAGCIVAQLTFGSGERMILGDLDEDDRERLWGTLKKTRERTVTKNKTLALAPDQILTDHDSKTFYRDSLKEFPGLQTKIPINTLQHIIEYKPEESIKKVTIPVMIIGAEQDIVCPVAESKRLYENANQPKELYIIENARHYDVYSGDNLTQSAGKALEWFDKHLKQGQ
jgi:fermentation-respiration switch protein FrsA (DUF1100 family)